jgi:hypothetical protein
MSKDLRETSAQAYQDVVMQMEARKWANEFNKQGVPKPVSLLAHLGGHL